MENKRESRQDDSEVWKQRILEEADVKRENKG